MVNTCFYTLMRSCLHQVCSVSGSIVAMCACAAALQLHIMADAAQLACELQADVVPGRLDSNPADDPNLFIPVLCLIGNIIPWRITMCTCIINGLILRTMKQTSCDYVLASDCAEKCDHFCYLSFFPRRRRILLHFQPTD